MSQDIIKGYNFMLDGLNCANCAAKIEDKLREQKELDRVIFSFATKKLIVTPSEAYGKTFTTQESLVQSLILFIQGICDAIEDGVHVLDLNGEKSIASGRNKKLTQSDCHNSHEDCCGQAHPHSHSHGHSEKKSHHSDATVGPAHEHDHGPVGGLMYVGEVLMGILLLLIVYFTNLLSHPYNTIAVLVMFLIIGRYVLLRAGKNILKGRWMDENFLMAIATIGAILIGDVQEALGVMVFYRIGILFEEKATEKSRSEIMSVIDMRPEVVTVLDEAGHGQVISAHEAQVGQILQVRAGDRIPLDGTIVSGKSTIDTSPVTGEPKPVTVGPNSTILSGCINLSGLIEMRVDQPLEESFVSKILNAVEMATANKPTVDRFITRFARYYTPVVLGITLVTIILPGLITGEWKYWIYTGLTFLVISCPCALVLSVPLAFFAGIGGSSKAGILFKGGLSMENASTAKVIAMDKTGTLTKGIFSVQRIEEKGAWSAEEILQYAATLEAQSTHPIGKSICQKARELNLSTLPYDYMEELAGQGIRGSIQGHEVLCGNRKFLEANSIPIVGSAAVSAGASQVFIGIDGQWAGLFLIRDVLKEDALLTVRKLRAQGYSVAMVTGDSQESADAIAQEATIDKVYAGLLPIDKLHVINELRKTYGSVMFVGDGINDAPVLAGANVGCAMGTGADAALEAADVVFMNGEVGAIEKALHFAKHTMHVAWQNIILAIIIKVMVMILGFTGYASLWLAVFADTGVMMICVFNSVRLLYKNV